MLIIKKIAINIWQMFPYFLRKNIDIFRRIAIWKKHNTIFVHVPKAAGVSVSNAIYGRPLGHFYARDIQKICPNIYRDAFTFAVVRHPIDRLYSAYNFSHNGGTDLMSMNRGKYYMNHPDFKNFEKFLYNWLAQKELIKLDGVFRPQYLYLFDDDDRLLVDKFYKLENIRNHYDEISKNIGRAFILQHDNKSDKETFNITPEMNQLIYELYQKDFELLGYSEQEN